MKLDYCRLMESLQRRPHDKVPITMRQLLEFREHLKACASCKKASDDMAKKYPEEPRIGPRPTSN